MITEPFDESEIDATTFVLQDNTVIEPGTLVMIPATGHTGVYLGIYKCAAVLVADWVAPGGQPTAREILCAGCARGLLRPVPIQ